MTVVKLRKRARFRVTNTLKVQEHMLDKPRVLVVEDEHVIACDITANLINMGCEVCSTVATGEGALGAWRSCQPDLVIMDVVLAGEMDGIQAALKMNETSRTAVIFLTSYGSADVLKRAKEAVPYAYLLKPFNPEQLRTTVEIALNMVEQDRQRTTGRDKEYDRLRQAAKEMTLSELRDKRRLVDDLDSKVGQQLFVTKLATDSLLARTKDPETVASLSRVSEMMSDTISNLSSSLAEAIPLTLGLFGLESGLKEMMDVVQSKYGVVALVEDDQLPKPLTDEVRDLVFSAVCGLVLHVVHCVGVRILTVALARNDQQVKVDIIGNGSVLNLEDSLMSVEMGCNFDPFVIKEKLAAIGGHLTCQSGHGGDFISVHAPLKQI